MNENKVVVVGGGAAGLMAAGRAAQNAQVLVLEKKERPCRKLLITGKGRCNLTNIAEVSDFLLHFHKSGRFLHQAFSRFFNKDLVDFFSSIGVATTVERGGRVFPKSEDAKEVAQALKSWALDQGVKIRTLSRVSGLKVEANRVVGAVVEGVQGFEACEKLILTTGGASYPATGSTGDGYDLARSVGHTIVPIRPALVPVETAGRVASQLQGVSLRNVKVKLFIDQKKKQEAFGEMLFTHYGLSGPIILTLSRWIVDALSQEKKVSLSIDLKPALDDKKLDMRLIREFKDAGKQKFSNLLKNLLPRKMADVCIDLTQIPKDKEGHHITSKERLRLRQWLKDFRFVVIGHRSFAEAIVTAGGIMTREVDPKTMESRRVKNLYFAGEVLDIDGDTGGYNLQAAFSTGWLAGRSCAIQEK